MTEGGMIGIVCVGRDEDAVVALCAGDDDIEDRGRRKLLATAGDDVYAEEEGVREMCGA